MLILRCIPTIMLLVNLLLGVELCWVALLLIGVLVYADYGFLYLLGCVVEFFANDLSMVVVY